jgi:hypothetical protein
MSWLRRGWETTTTVIPSIRALAASAEHMDLDGLPGRFVARIGRDEDERGSASFFQHDGGGLLMTMRNYKNQM